MSLSKKIHLREDEEIIEVIRSSALAEWWKYAFGLAFLATTAFFTFWLLARGWWGRSLFALGIIFGIYIILRTWFFNYHNYIVVTSERLADINRASWLDEVVSSIGYHDLKDIMVRRRGVGAAIFNYGTITVLTKDKNLALEIPRVRKPERVQNLILQSEEAYRTDYYLKNDESVYASFTDLLPELSEAELTVIDKKIHDCLEQFNEVLGEQDQEMI